MSSERTKKYYSVRNGKTPGVYETWGECEAQVKGYSNAVYKSFKTREEALAYLEGYSVDPGAQGTFGAAQLNDEVEARIKSLGEGELIAFVDGSYDASSVTSGFGAVMIGPEGVIDELSGSFDENDGEDFMSMRNVSAELCGVRAAVDYALSRGFGKLTVYYDYEGIGRWADGSWQAKKELTMEYRDFITGAMDRIELELVKVPAHSGVVYNEMVDKLAKAAASKK